MSSFPRFLWINYQEARMADSIADRNGDLGNKYALASLKNTRGTLAAEIVQLERQLRHRREALLHVDATIKIMDGGNIDLEKLPKKRLKRVKLFRHGELNRLILDALREAGRPLSTTEIAFYVLKAGGHDKSAMGTMKPRVRGNLAYLEKRRVIVKMAEMKNARWDFNQPGKYCDPGPTKAP